MKKIIISSISLLLGMHTALAQTTVTGKVVDGKDIPVQGALVEVKGTNDKTTTDYDGLFSIKTRGNAKKVTAHYVGFNSETKRIKPNMKIRMSQTSWWRQKPKGSWFLGVQGLKPEYGLDGFTPGVMFGYLKKVGFYAKGFYSPGKSTDDDYHYTNEWLTGKIHSSYFGGSAGFIARLGCPIHLYFGVGYMERRVAWKTYGGSWLDASDYYQFSENVVPEAGLMLRTNKWIVNVGLMWHDKSEYYYNNNYYINHDYYDYDSDFDEEVMLNIGVSYCF